MGLVRKEAFSFLKCGKVVFFSVKEQSLLRHDAFLPFKRVEIWDPELFWTYQIVKT